MLAGALGTYAAALIVIAAATATGAGVLALTGSRSLTWTAPAVGLAAITVLAWWTVRLPGHGLTALIVVAAASVAGALAAGARLRGLGAALLGALPALALALAAASVPFVVEGHFGIIGTGFNVDMSQHLFAASWIADPAGPAPGLFQQGYPLGPHALAVATGEVSGEAAPAFSGVTIAVAVAAALTALAAFEGWPRWRATIAAALVAFAYLGASYFAQGSFKELFEATFLIGFILCLREVVGGKGERNGWLSGVPLAILGAGALYAYSAPGLIWLVATAALWGGWELARRRADPARALRAALPATATALAVLVALAAPELDRIADFGGSVGTVSERAGPGTLPRDLHAARGAVEGGAGAEPVFDNDLGNLFGQISPLEAFGVWPSGDFRVAPGDGAVPAAVFYLGALLGALALALGVLAAVREGERALLAALAAAAAIWLLARLGSTPYTAAKGLCIFAPVAMLVAVRAALAPGMPIRGEGAPARLLHRVLALGFVAAAALSGGLALANAPVGPREYSPGVTALSSTFAGAPTLLLAPPTVLDTEHGRDFYGWELREAKPACVTPSFGSEADAPSVPPEGIRFVLTTDGRESPPFRGLVERGREDGVALWEVRSAGASSIRIRLPAPGSTECGLRSG